jgi:uncharacterized membrane protein YfcA
MAERAAPTRRVVADTTPAAAETASAGAEPGEPQRARWVTPRLAMIGIGGGVLSGLLGVGGGVVMVPLLVLWAGYSQRDSHAMSLGAIIPISVAGILTFGIAGKVQWTDAAALAVGAVGGALVGTGILARIDERVLKIVFGCFLVLVALSMGLRA